MASTGGSAPPIFADAAKFNGANWVSWKGLIRIAADLRGVFGYLDGSITNPGVSTMPTSTPPGTTPTSTPGTTMPSPPHESSWESNTPTASEWKVRNAWAMGLLIYNTSDPVGLGINIHGTAADAWNSYMDTYDVASEVAVLNAEQDLRGMTYNESQDFVEFISTMRTKWSNATSLGATINDKSFRTIVLNALPRSWDPIVTTLYTSQTSREAINQLMTHWARISRDRVANPQPMTSALQASTGKPNRDRQRTQSQLVCINANCNRRGHTIENCYWPGGGKAGQFPLGFGKREGMRGAMNSSNSGQQTSANVADSSTTQNPTEPQVFALAAITEITSKVPSNTHSPPPNSHDIVTSTTRTSTDFVRPGEKAGEVGETMTTSREVDSSSILQSNIVISSNPIMTLLDSGVSDHCFVQRDTFTKYLAIIPPRTGQLAGKHSTFSIEGTGTTEFSTKVNTITTKIVMSNVLHMPHLRSNLISVSKLVSKGSRVSFEDNKAFVNNAQGRVVLTATRRNGLYVVDTIPIQNTSINIAQARRKTVTYEVWHRCLGHLPIDVIKQMSCEKLVDGLEIDGTSGMRGMCEDCIFGKHTTHPFNNTVPTELEPLDHVYIDIWGPAPVESAGGAKYFMLIMDGATSFRKIYFLSSKSADTTLRVFKEFHKESERQTGKRLKHVRLDMGHKWHNQLWDTYIKEHGILLDFTTPYAHQQNGKAERSMRTLLDMARTLLADSGLPQKYWADAIQTAVYTRNFIPPTRNPKMVPAEYWSQRRQDISHLRPFGSTAYAHIPTEISPSKLSPRSVKLTLLGYFEHTGYKLLDCATDKTFKARDVIFKETPPHYSTDPLVVYPQEGNARTSEPMAIASRPKPISMLHPTQPVTDAGGAVGDKEDSETEVTHMLEAPEVTNEMIASGRPRWETKLSRRMQESLEYLERTRANVVLGTPSAGECYDLNL